jgi:chemotaxis protein methyltransferase CheR
VNRTLARVAELVRQRTGVSLPPARAAALRGALHRAAPGLDPDAFLREVAEPGRGPGLMDRLIDEVTVKETSFLRDRVQFDAIPWHLLAEPGAEGAGRRIRVWSAGCASGEEAYTLAMLALEALAPASATVDVLGTDVSGAAISAAITGCYRERAVRAVEPAWRERYLEPEPDGSYLAGERLRGLVRFARHNLIRDPIPPLSEAPFDLVVCRNVLIYFIPQQVARVTRLLERAVRPGGMLLLGAADALQRPPPQARKRVTEAGGPPAAARPAPGAQPSARHEQQHERQPVRQPAPPPPPAVTREQRLADALAAAGAGRSSDALAHVASLLAEDPFDADAHFVQGLVTLEAGEPGQAAEALRRALYTDPAFGLAAFTLGRAYDALGDRPAAQRSYARALKSFGQGNPRHEPLLQQVDLADVAAACRARLEGEP